MMFAQSQNHLVIHFVEHILVINKCITVIPLLTLTNLKLVRYSRKVPHIYPKAFHFFLTPQDVPH